MPRALRDAIVRALAHARAGAVALPRKLGDLPFDVVVRAGARPPHALHTPRELHALGADGIVTLAPDLLVRFADVNSMDS